MTTNATKPSGTPESYIGSFISLTSKSDIRYEGVLFYLNPQDSTIGLKNVRSFGTEGRKMDGPQVLPSDRVYEYIYFRGIDIKDLKVMSSPPIHSEPALPNDPAIIQSHSYSSSASTSLPSAATVSVANISSSAHMGLPSSSLQGSLPLYQPLGILGSSPYPPNANVNPVAMPTYWQGSGPPGTFPNFHHQSMLLQSEPGMVISSALQQQTQHPSINAPLSSSTSNFPEIPHSWMPPFSTGSSFSSSMLLPPPALPSNFPVAQSAALTFNFPPNLMPNNAPSAIPTVGMGSSPPLVTPLTTSRVDIKSLTPPATDKAIPTVGLTLPGQIMPPSMSSVVEAFQSNQTEASVPHLVTPGQLLQSGATTVSLSDSSQGAHKDIEVFQPSSSETLPSGLRKSQPPLLPLPSSKTEQLNEGFLHTHRSSRGHSQGRGYRSNGNDLNDRHTHKGNSWARVNVINGAAINPHHLNRGNGRGRENGMNVAAFNTYHSNRGHARGRGHRISNPVTKFTEDFDFEAMNEKFNKDDVWGHLGKSYRAQLNNGDEKESDEVDSEVADEDALPESGKKSVYVKDDFFDSLSCDALGHESRRERPKFSEQRRLDVETFGEFQRYGGGHGGWGSGHGGRARGSYNGRGSAYAVRGRGRAMLSRIT